MRIGFGHNSLSHITAADNHLRLPARTTGPSSTYHSPEHQHPQSTHTFHLTSYPPCYRASPITAMYVAGRGNPRAWGTVKADREPGRSRVIQADARNPASCTEYGQAPPLSLLLAQAMTAQHGSKYGLGERVGVWLSESPSAASRPLKGDAEEGDGASNAPICPATVRHGQWFRRGNLRCVEMLRHRRQRQACPGEASGLSVKVDVRHHSE